MNKARIEDFVDACYQPANYATVGRVGLVVSETLIRAAILQCAREAYEDAARAVETKYGHCDCIDRDLNGCYYQRCECGNSDNMANAEMWCASMNDAAAIRSRAAELEGK